MPDHFQEKYFHPRIGIAQFQFRYFMRYSSLLLLNSQYANICAMMYCSQYLNICDCFTNVRFWFLFHQLPVNIGHIWNTIFEWLSLELSSSIDYLNNIECSAHSINRNVCNNQLCIAHFGSNYGFDIEGILNIIQRIVLENSNSDSTSTYSE